MNRRAFIKSSIYSAAAAAVFSSAHAADQPAGTAGAAAPAAEMVPPPLKAALRISSQEGRIPGKSLKEKVENLVKFGAAGLEVNGGNLPARIAEIKEAINGTGIKISAVCAADGPYIVPDEQVRRKNIDNAKRLLAAAGELGSTGVIMVPAFNNIKDQLVGKPGRDLLMEILKEIGDAAAKAGTFILMEPLNRREAFFLRQLADAASICRDVNNQGVGMMGDFYHMYFEETSDTAAFLSAGKYLHHVHLASIKRNLPGQDERSFVEGFRGLKMIGYQGYISLECGVRGDPLVEIPKSFRFLEQQWAQA